MAPGAINLALGAPKLAPGLIKKCIETRYLIKGERNFAPWPKNYKLCPDKISGLTEEYLPLKSFTERLIREQNILVQKRMRYHLKKEKVT